MTISDTTRLAVIGDSITAGYGVAVAESWTFRFENRRAGANVMALGNYGATVRRWLQQHIYALGILPIWQPTTVMIALGGNEWHITRPAPEYADHLRQLVQYIRTLVGSRIVLLHYYAITAGHDPTGCDAPPGDTVGCVHASPPDSWAAYGQAMQQVATAQNCHYVDISGTRNWGQYLFDQAHLTAAGHALLEQDIYNALVALP